MTDKTTLTETVMNPDFLPLNTSDNKAEQERIEKPSLNFIQDSWRRLKKNKGAVIALWILVFVSIVSVASIWISPHDPAEQRVEYMNLPPRVPGIPFLDGKTEMAGQVIDKYEQAGVPKGENFWLGTDGLGRDVFSRLLMGTRMSLLIALVAAVLDITIGVAYGLVSGMKGGRVDTIMQRFIEVLSGIPNLVVMILMLTIFNPGLLSIILAMVITGWITMARIVRGQTMKVRNEEYILAAETLGESKLKIAGKHILPNIGSVIVIQLMFSIPSAIFFEAFLGFLGIGLRPPVASLGTLLNEGYKTFQYLPHLLLVPAITLSVIMISFNLLADGLRDAFDPKMKD